MGIRTAQYVLVLLAISALYSGRKAYTQDKATQMNKTFSWATPATPGRVCALSQNGRERNFLSNHFKSESSFN